jgi:anti-sigma regulatory factor (Ser/Thr protein kinase)
MESKFKRKVNSMDRIFEFVGEFAAANEFDNSTAFTINFVVEEIFTNCSYT